MLLDEFGDLMSEEAEAAARAAGLPIAVTPIGERMLPAAICTPWQFYKLLNAQGFRATVEAAVAAADQDTQDGFAKASEFRSDDPLVLTMGAGLGMSPLDIRNLIEQARAL